MLTNYGLVNGGEVDVYLADEGIVGLMGKHILSGRELPIFFYGQHYLGALEAYLAAAVFAFLGPGFFQLRLVPFLFSLLIPGLVYRFTYLHYSVAAARWATTIALLAPVYYLQWNLKARGGFVEHIALVLVFMLLFWRFYLHHDRRPGLAFALGVAAGIAVWVNQLALAYVGLMGVLLFFNRDDKRGLATLAVGFFLGSSLLLGYNIVHPFATFRTLARKALLVNRVDESERGEDWALKGASKRFEALGQGVDKLGIVFGVPPRAGVERLGLSSEAREDGPLTATRRLLWPLPALVFGVALGAARPRRGRSGWGPVGSDQVLGLFILVTFVVGYVSPRYMLPAYPLAAVLAGVLCARQSGGRRRAIIAGVGLVLIFNLASWADAVMRRDIGDSARVDVLLEKLDELGLTRCFSAAPLYHVVFAANERVIVSALQKDRYPAYSTEVEAANRICYIFREDQQRKRQHQAFMSLLELRGIRYNTAKASVYNIIYWFTPSPVLSAQDLAKVRHQETGRVRIRGVFEPSSEESHGSRSKD